ncbi:MAG: hypothetical protein K2F97_01915 [Muribaculaceae bacterium]|nr:hypothetical protein [Muribaculaceae bacterium]
MKKIALFAMAALAMAACSDNDAPGPGRGGDVTPPKKIELNAAETVSVESANAFAFATFGQLYGPDENTLFSPLSAQMALAMTANGATGETRAELLGALCGEGASLADLNTLYGKLCAALPVTDKATRMTIANSFWHDAQLTPAAEFGSTLGADYGAVLRSYDRNARPEAAEAVNSWVKDATGGLIPRLVSENEIGAFMIANALYFKSEWQEKFDRSKSVSGDFTNADGSKSTATYMNGSVPGQCGVVEDVTVGQLPFGNGAYVLTAVLPAAGQSVDEAMAVVATYSPDVYGYLGSGNLTVKMPRFTTKSSLDLIPVCKALGIERMFGADAELGGIVNADVYVSLLRQACTIEVNEDGAEAAAATIVGGELMATPASSLVLDRAFGYMIRETSTGMIVFMGAVNRF